MVHRRRFRFINIKTFFEMFITTSFIGVITGKIPDSFKSDLSLISLLAFLACREIIIAVLQYSAISKTTVCVCIIQLRVLLSSLTTYVFKHELSMTDSKVEQASAIKQLMGYFSRSKPFDKGERPRFYFYFLNSYFCLFPLPYPITIKRTLHSSLCRLCGIWKDNWQRAPCLALASYPLYGIPEKLDNSVYSPS